MVDINILLPHSDDTWIVALTIPPSDTQRLCRRPLKWLRFVAFAVCGAEGDLSEMPGGPDIQYAETSSIDPFVENYYDSPTGSTFSPGSYIFPVDL